MRLAYADPPYLGCAKLYPEHEDAGLYDHVLAHVNLMDRMDDEYDGWALSLSSPSLRHILPYAPENARVAAWVKPFAAFKRNVRCAYTWEPVIFRPGCDRSADGATVTRDHLSQPIALKKGLVGAKPDAFGRWVLDLLGYRDGLDSIHDLFPGTGLMERVTRQMVMAFHNDIENSKGTGDMVRRAEKAGIKTTVLSSPPKDPT